MNNHLAALMALTPEGIDAFDTNVPEQPPQRYFVFRAPTFKRDSEASSRAVLDVDDYFSVMACGRDTNQVRDIQAEMQDALDRSHPVVDGFDARALLRSTGGIDIDRSRVPHIAHATDLYRYRATPV